MQDQPVSVVNSDAYKSAPCLRNVPDATHSVSIFCYSEKHVAVILDLVRLCDFVLKLMTCSLDS